jgi:hypothetical protein
MADNPFQGEMDSRIILAQFPYYLLSEILSKDLEISSESKYFGQDFGLAMFYGFLANQEHCFWHSNGLLFFGCSSHPFPAVTSPLFFSLKGTTFCASSAILRFFFQGDKFSFNNKTGDELQALFFTTHVSKV